MTEPTDPLSALEALSAQFREQEGAVRKSLKAIGEKLGAICSGLNIHCSARDHDLASDGQGERTYGHMFFNGRDLLVAYRSTDDDITDAADPDPDGPRYLVDTIDTCPGLWLHALLKASSLSELLPQIGEQINERLRAVSEMATQVDQVLVSPQAAIASSFEQAAKSLGYDEIVKEWKDAQSKVHTDPDGAITKANTLIESVCKHLIHDAGASLPSKQVIQNLFAIAAKFVQLDPDGRADTDLKQLCRALASVAQHIGTLRTHFGDAHGYGPTERALAVSHAQLAVSAAGTISTFVMERWTELKPKAA